MTLQDKVNDLFTEWSGHSGPVVDIVSGSEIIDCALCGYRHVVPLPTEEELQETYAKEYYRDEKPTYLSHASEDYQWATLAFQDRLEIFKSHLPSDRRRLLDIGSGPGYFLKYATDCGWKAEGVEPSQQAAAHSQELGLKVTQAFFGPKTAPTLGTFDVINMNNMLEHVPAPRDLVCEAVSILKEGGLVCITVPNDYNPFQETLRDKAGLDPWWVVPSHHLNYFTFDSISQLMENAGLEILSQTTSFPMEMFLLMGDNYVGNDTLGRACHTKRKTFDLLLQQSGNGQLRRDLYALFAKLGLGREAIVIGKKV